MKQFKNVAYTKPWDLLGLMALTALCFLLSMSILGALEIVPILKVGASLGIALFCYFKLKRFVVKTTDFSISDTAIGWKDKKLELKNIRAYKIHWMRGASIKLYLKNGKSMRLSANSDFCDADAFVQFAKALDGTLMQFNGGQMVRKYSLLETPIGRYTLIGITICLALLILYNLLFKTNGLDPSVLGLTLVSLSILWSGLRMK